MQFRYAIKTVNSKNEGGNIMKKSAQMALIKSAALASTALWFGVAPAQAQTATSAPAAAEEDSTKDIVVTGTQIRGVPPVGSSVISFNTADIQKTGLLSTTDILRAIPQVSGIGPGESTTGTTFQNANLNIGRSNALNLRGIGIQATLTLLNGRRLPSGGFAAQLFDPSSIPAIALGRIDVVADGASATYGSDAVAGVANLILRTDIEGVEARGRYGFADNYTTQSVSVLAGHKWDTGRFMIAGDYSWNSELLQSDRAQYFDCNQTAVGGINNCTNGGAPGNIIYGTTRYALPGGSGVGVTEAQLNTATPNKLASQLYTTVIPKNRRASMIFTARQEIGNNITIWTEDLFFERRGKFYTGSPVITPAAVPVPSTNPGFVNIAGRAQGAGATQVVEYSVYNDIGDGRAAFSTETGYQLSFGTDVKLGSNWQLSAYYEYNADDNLLVRTNEINNNLLRTALACTVGGPCLNPYGTGGSASNTAAAKTFLGYTKFDATYSAHVLNAKIDGALVHLPGGDLKVAVGVQHLSERFAGVNTTTAGAAATSLSDIRTTATFGRTRKITSVYGEAIVPVFGEDNAAPGFQKLTLNLALRHDNYNDVGGTTNPKLGINWSPVSGLTLHGSWGKSFRAPTLSDIDPLSTVGLLNSTTIVSGKTPSNNTLIRVGGNGSLKPETATTWSLGVDFKPESIPGLFASVNYYNINYQNVIDTPGNQNAVFSDPLLAPYVIIQPTVQQITDLIATPVANGVYAPPPFALFKPDGTSNIYAIADGRRNNTGSIKTQGLDLNLNYRFNAGASNWTLGATGTYVFKYEFQAVPGGVVADRVNQANYPLGFKARGQLGWSNGGLSANAFVNYQNAYRVVGLVANNQLIPALVSPAVQDERVSAYTTVDLNLSYTFGENASIAKGLTFLVAAQNLFNAKPPFARVSNSQEYDSTNASVLGRQISFEVRMKF
jgi:iron complex outermembrane recepter protein